MAIETIYTYTQGLENTSFDTQKVILTAFIKQRHINTSVALTHVAVGVDIFVGSVGAVATIIKKVGFYNDNNKFIESEYSGQLPNEMTLQKAVYVQYALGGFQCDVHSVICIRVFEELAMKMKSGKAHFHVGAETYYDTKSGRIVGAHHVVELERGAASPQLVRKVFAAGRRDAAKSAGLSLAKTGVLALRRHVELRSGLHVDLKARKLRRGAGSAARRRRVLSL